MPKITDISDSLFRGELDESADISIPSVAAWLRFNKNIGELNNLINTNYSIDQTTLEIIDTNGNLIGDMETSIYCQLYLISYYTRQSRKFLGAAGTEIVQEISSDGGRVSFVNRTQLAKTFLDLRKEAKDTLYKMINWYKRNKYQPMAVDGDDINPFARTWPSPYYHNQMNATC